MPLMPVYARDVLAVGPMGLGVISSAMGAGYLFGALAASPLRNIKSKGFALGWTGMLWDVAMVNLIFEELSAVGGPVVRDGIWRLAAHGVPGDAVSNHSD